MIKKNKNILKHSSVDLSFPEISPAKNFIPNWYKDTPPFKDGHEIPKRFPFNLTFKKCVVFSDSFMTGYMLPLPVDICVEKTEIGQLISWNDESDNFVELRDNEISKLLPTPTGYSEQHYVWKTKNMFKIPKGYSAFLGHPLNRFDLPFLNTMGIVDSDKVHLLGSFPFFIAEGWEGTIPAGTPYLQVLPFKRENWEHEIDILSQSDMYGKIVDNAKFYRQPDGGVYKNKVWSRREYR
jgi:hypothetical protein